MSKVDRSPGHSLLVLGTLALVAAGCSFADSSVSLSKSISSPFESSSASSGGGEAAYRDDVRDYTYAYARSNPTANQESFDRGLATVANKHGISNWESDFATWKGIGAGLKKANVGDAQLEGYMQSLAGSDSSRRAAIQQGYDEYRP